MKKGLTVFVMMVVLVMSIFSNVLAGDRFDGRKAFFDGYYDYYNENQREGTWSWVIYYSPDESAEIMLTLGFIMEGSDEALYPPVMTVTAEDWNDGRGVQRLPIDSVTIKTGGREYYIPYLEPSNGEYGICLGMNGMEMVKQMANKGFTLYVETSEGTLKGNPQNSDPYYKDLKQELKKLVNSKWWNYFDSYTLDIIEENYPIYR